MAKKKAKNTPKKKGGPATADRAVWEKETTRASWNEVGYVATSRKHGMIYYGGP